MGCHFNLWKLQSGEHISFIDENGTRQILKIIGRARSGYKVHRFGERDDEVLADTDLNLLILSRNYTHHPGDVAGLSDARRHLLFMEWEHFSPKVVFEARDYRAVIVAAVDRARPDYRNDEACIEAVLETLWPKHNETWSERELAIRVEERRIKLAKARDPVDPSAPEIEVIERKKPHWRTVKEWWAMWRMAGRDARVLLPLYDRRGRRDPRFAPVVYELLEKVVTELWLKPPKKSKTSVWDTLKRLCDAEGEKVPHRITLGRFIHNYVNDRDEDKAIYGWRSAYLRFTAHQPVAPPERPLEQVEIDHCLLDIYVRDERTGKLLGRPWLTAIIDRRTRVICGIHLSWEAPSYASVQRALAHAFWPKDLSPYDLKNDWPVFGLPDIVISDQGREFKSMSLAEAEKAMHFQVVRLKRKRPWLKGRIERAFRTIQVQVFSHQQGAIVYSGIRDLDHYNPQKSTEATLSDVKQQLLEWIVDVYHQAPHSGLRAASTGVLMSPLDFFKQEVVRCGGVRPPRSFSEIIQLIGAASTRTIQKTGVKLFGLTYWDRRLSKLLERRGGRTTKWQIRVDPFDIGRLWLFDDDKVSGGWLQVDCTRPDLSEGVSIYQHRQHRKMAYRNKKKGGNVSDDAVAKAKRACEDRFRQIMSEAGSVATAAQQARYGHSNGIYFTPLMGMTDAEKEKGLPLVGAGTLRCDERGTSDSTLLEAETEQDPLHPQDPQTARVTPKPDAPSAGQGGFDLRDLLSRSNDWRTS